MEKKSNSQLILYKSHIPVQLSEFIINLSLPADLLANLETVYFFEHPNHWPVLSTPVVSDEGIEMFFNPVVISILETRLGLSFERELLNQGEVCFANTEEVSPAYRTTFSAGELLHYVFSQLPPVRDIIKVQRTIYLPFPGNTDYFWELVMLGKVKKKFT